MYINDYYKVPARIGEEVKYNGEFGVIYKDGGPYLCVNFYKDKPGFTRNIHPTDEGLVYLEKEGKIRKMTRSQQRYKRYQEHGDGFDNFLDFCYWHDSKVW